MPSRRLAPDTALKISLEAGARRRLEDGMPFEVVVEELRAEAAGRTDLLAQAAGSLIGLYLARPTATQPRSVAAFAALVLAGADPQALVERADESRERMTSAP
ncbi:hypothetical protein [Nocardioides zeae]|uniref:Uncharacterized protein n=1 Tax=Nocardioides zeae TaxID=1457234 RepID=A0AAJ1U778_9ACTN|nr:hypothetical protein [Nocardioides zeae]MDQ1106618.1 hypothetical protein [Nocardioides zeae]